MKIRKTQQPADYPANSIHDSYNTSATDTYSCNYINNAIKEVYSTDEQVIGKWINGKPIYRKVFTNIVINATHSSWANLIDISSLSVDRCLKLYGYIFNSGNNDLVLPYNIAGYYISIKRLGNNIVVLNNDTAGGADICIIVEYTKTTD